MQSSPVPAGPSLRRVRWLVWGIALVIGASAGVVIAVLHGSGSAAPAPSFSLGMESSAAAATWPAGERRAPDFRLVDQAGAAVSLKRFRGRPVILTFIDPLCRNLCPREAQVLDQVVSKLPAGSRPAIVAVSVNVFANARRNLLTDVAKWRLTPQWHWAVGSTPSLQRVWRSYEIAVEDQPKTITGVTVHNIVHTEAAYVIDASGHQRALFLWPFRTADVAAVLKRIG